MFGQGLALHGHRVYLTLLLYRELITEPHWRWTMPKGHAPKREQKKSKRKLPKQTPIASPVFTSTDVEVIKKKRKPKVDEGE